MCKLKPSLRHKCSYKLGNTAREYSWVAQSCVGVWVGVGARWPHTHASSRSTLVPTNLALRASLQEVQYLTNSLTQLKSAQEKFVESKKALSVRPAPGLPI